MGEVVGAAQSVHEPQSVGAVGLGIIHPEYGLGGIIQEDQVDPGGDLLVGFFPGDGLEFIPHPFQGAFDPVGVIFSALS